MQPDAHVLATILKSCAKLPDYDRAKLYWRALQKSQGSREGLITTAPACSCLLKRACADLCGCAAVVPNIVCYNCMIQSALTACQRTDAFNLLDELRSKGMKPTDITMRALILVCAASNLPHQAFSVRARFVAALACLLCTMLPLGTSVVGPLKQL